MVLEGVSSQGTVYRGDAKLRPLSVAWATVFQEKPFPEALARAVLEENLVPKAETSTPPPTREEYASYLAAQTDSGAGPDGLPYSAWQATGDAGLDTLVGCGAELQSEPLP